jgi:hypothetical protein
MRRISLRDLLPRKQAFISWTNESCLAVCIFLTNKLLFLQDTSIWSFWHCCRCGRSFQTVIISKVCCLCLWRRFELWQYFKVIPWAMSFWKFSLFAILIYKMWGFRPQVVRACWQGISFSLLFTSFYTYRQVNQHLHKWMSIVNR